MESLVFVKRGRLIPIQNSCKGDKAKARISKKTTHFQPTFELAFMKIIFVFFFCEIKIDIEVA